MRRIRWKGSGDDPSPMIRILIFYEISFKFLIITFSNIFFLSNSRKEMQFEHLFTFIFAVLILKF